MVSFWVGRNDLSVYIKTQTKSKMIQECYDRCPDDDHFTIEDDKTYWDTISIRFNKKENAMLFFIKHGDIFSNIKEVTGQ